MKRVRSALAGLACALVVLITGDQYQMNRKRYARAVERDDPKAQTRAKAPLNPSPHTGTPDCKFCYGGCAR